MPKKKGKKNTKIRKDERKKKRSLLPPKFEKK